MASGVCWHSMIASLPRSNGTAGAGLEIVRARPLLGTLVQICASGPAAETHRAVDAAFTIFERLQRLLSYQDPDSELSQLNRQPLHQPRRVDPQTYAVLFAALHFARLSDGAFDPCVGFELEHWDLLPRHGSTSASAPSVRGSWRDIELMPDQHVSIHRPMRIDLGGIAKGYAVDLALEALLLGGASEVLVNAGGDLRVAGSAIRQIGLRHPLAPHTSSESVSLHNAALATSGAYYSQQRRAQGEVSALVDPLVRGPHLHLGSVSVRAATCMSADALTKVVLFAPTAVAEHALAASDAMAYVQRPPVGASLATSWHGPELPDSLAYAH
jgi:FAD:protein FMN transferase